MTNAQERARGILASLHREQYIDDRTDMEWKYQHNVKLVADALALVEAETYEKAVGAVNELIGKDSGNWNRCVVYAVAAIRQQAQRAKEGKG